MSGVPDSDYSIDPARARLGSGFAPPIPWRALLIRTFVVVVPAQVLGLLVGAQIVVATGLLQDHSWPSSLINIIAGAVAGIAVGLLVTPLGGRRRSYLAVTGGFGLASYALLMALAQTRLSGAMTHPAWSGYLLGAVWTVGVQLLVAAALWAAKHAPE